MSAFSTFRRHPFSRIVLLLVLGVCTLAAAFAGLKIGTLSFSAADMAEALLRFDHSRAHIVFHDVRLPRVVAGLIAGAALAVAGAIMQAITGNPIASPGLLGVNAGAAFAVVFATSLFEAKSEATYIWYAFAGAVAAACIVYILGSTPGREGTPIRLALSGAILSTFLAALTAAILIFDQATLDSVRAWLVGSLAGRRMASAAAVAPYVAAGLAGSLLFSREIMTLSLGEVVARSIGQNLAVWRAVAAVLVVMLAGSAVALAGPVGFVGLVVPHMARLVVGSDYRWIIPFCAIGGACLVTTADGAVRGLLPSNDVPVGVTMAFLGTPVFIYLVRHLAAFR